MRRRILLVYDKTAALGFTLTYHTRVLDPTNEPSQGRSAKRPTDGSPNLVHCSYHKCLTVYYRRVMDGVFNRCLPWSAGYRHYNSHLDDFYEGFQAQRVASVNNRALDLERLGRFRLTRFLRDPRDLIVSGYFYHRRGAEAWVEQPAPTTEAWYFAHAVLPEAMKGQEISYADYLRSLPEEEGLLAEMELRALHLQSMARWPSNHPDIATFRYEDVLGDEIAVFRAIFDHYGLTFVERSLGLFFARRHAMARRRKDPHIRNPSSGQWRLHFTPRVRRAFDSRYAGLIRQLGYPAD